MKHCDTCGRPISDAFPYKVCPQCLFAEALTRDQQPNLPGESGAGKQEAWAPGLRLRTDFFQKYDLLERVAQGGQGDVWKVWDFELRRHVAMKRLHDKALMSNPAVYRFLAEAQITSQLEHPGILPVLDVGLDPDGRPFYTTQLLNDITLAEVWRKVQDRRQREWSMPRVLELLLRVCDVIGHAHSRGVIHRDLKPSNILVAPFGDVRVIDWGSAHVLAEARERFQETFVPLNQETLQTDRGEAIWAEPGSPLLTSNAGHPVTILFTPPEILSGHAEQPGCETDVYAMGVILYELLTGRLPYSDRAGAVPDKVELQKRILRGVPMPIRELNPSASRDLVAIARKAMARSPANRYRSMPELADDLRAVLEIRPVQARQPNLLLTFQKWAARNIAPVLTVGLILLIVTIAFAVARGFKSERDTARQITAMRSAELASRSGQWRQALKDWGAAEAAGYNDPVHLALERAEAWTVLDEPVQAQTLLASLARRSDLGNWRGEVLLRLGEHQLFDPAAANQGVEHVRNALAAGLTGADQFFAKGLLADTTPDALRLFRQALHLNPYDYDAHVQSLGLEFLLGRHQELKSHLRIFKVLYPDDPSPVFLEAAELAVQGNMTRAASLLNSAQNSSKPILLRELKWGLQALDAASRYYSVSNFLKLHATNAPPPGLFSSDLAAVFGSTAAKKDESIIGLRLPDLPCIRQGVFEGNDALHRLMVPFLSDPVSAVAAIESSWQHHPEVTLPLMAGIVLAQRTPEHGPEHIPLLQLQARLFQLASDSSCVIPGAGPLARYLAAKAQFELARAHQTNSAAMRLACLKQIRRAIESSTTSVAEYRAYFDFAFQLGNHDLARDLLDHWHLRQPDDVNLLRDQIRLEVAAGTFTTALTLIDKWLSEHPGDAWAKEQKRITVGQLTVLLKSVNDSSNSVP